jgi:dihydrofolate reductase
LGKPLPGRENWVLSRSADIPGVRVFRDLDEIPSADAERHIFLIGGAELYTALLPRCSEILLTHVDLEVSGDAFFPAFEEDFDSGEIIQTGSNYEIRRYCRLG